MDHGGDVAAKHGIARSPEWGRIARQHLERHPRCVACKIGTHLDVHQQVHHIFPFHFCVTLGRPDLELDERNLITLCETTKTHPAENHHLLVGHLDDYESANLHVARNAEHTFHGMTSAQIRASHAWRELAAARIAHLGDMSAEERHVFRHKMDEVFPRRG